MTRPTSGWGWGGWGGVVCLILLCIGPSQTVQAASAEALAARDALLWGHWGKMVEHAAAWGQEDAEHAGAHLLLAVGYHLTGQHQASYAHHKWLMEEDARQQHAMRWSEDLVTEHPENAFTYYILSSAYSSMSYGDVDSVLGRGRIGQSVRALKKAAKLDPTFVLAYSNLAGLVLSETVNGGRPFAPNPSSKPARDVVKEAMGYAQQAATLDPDALDTALGLAAAYTARGEYDTAVVQAQKVVAVAPTPIHHMTLASIYMGQYAYEQAAEQIGEAIALDPQEAYFHANLSLCQYGLESYGEAIRSAQTAIELNPGRNSLMAFYVLGMANHELGQSAASVDALQRVIELDPESEFGSMAQVMLVMLEAIERAQATRAQAGGTP